MAQIYPLNRFGGLLTDIVAQKLNGESPDLHNTKLKLGGTGIAPRGGTEVVEPNLSFTDSTVIGPYQSYFKIKNQYGRGWIYGIQEQPSGEITLLHYWSNKYPANADEAFVTYFAEIKTPPPLPAAGILYSNPGNDLIERIFDFDFDAFTTSWSNNFPAGGPTWSTLSGTLFVTDDITFYLHSRETFFHEIRLLNRTPISWSNALDIAPYKQYGGSLSSTHHTFKQPRLLRNGLVAITEYYVALNVLLIDPSSGTPTVDSEFNLPPWTWHIWHNTGPTDYNDRPEIHLFVTHKNTIIYGEESREVVPATPFSYQNYQFKIKCVDTAGNNLWTCDLTSDVQNIHADDYVIVSDNAQNCAIDHTNNIGYFYLPIYRIGDTTGANGAGALVSINLNTGAKIAFQQIIHGDMDGGYPGGFYNFNGSRPNWLVVAMCINQYGEIYVWDSYQFIFRFDSDLNYINRIERSPGLNPAFNEYLRSIFYSPIEDKLMMLEVDGSFVGTSKWQQWDRDGSNADEQQFYSGDGDLGGIYDGPGNFTMRNTLS